MAPAHRRVDGVQGQARYVRLYTQKAHVDPLVVRIGRVQRLVGHATNGRGHGAPLRTGIVQVVLVVHENDVGGPETTVKHSDTIAIGGSLDVRVDPDRKNSLGKGGRPRCPGNQVFGIHGINAIARAKHPVSIFAFHNAGGIVHAGPPILCREG